MERRSAPSPARPATRPRTGRDPRPPLQRDWSAAPPAAPAAPRAAGRPYTEPGCVVRRYHGTFYSILRGLGFFAGLRAGRGLDVRTLVVLASCDLSFEFVLSPLLSKKHPQLVTDIHSIPDMAPQCPYGLPVYGTAARSGQDAGRRSEPSRHNSSAREATVQPSRPRLGPVS